MRGETLPNGVQNVSSNDMRLSTAPVAAPVDTPGPLAATQAMFAALLQRADVAGVSLRPPPPLPTTCCGRGCNGCVWEGFYAAAAYWREDAELRLQDRPTP